MTRIKRGTSANKRRRNILKHTKGFRWGRKSKFRLAKDALLHAWTYAFRDRKAKKRTFRALWQTRINSGCRTEGISYSRFIHLLKKKNIELDRKILAELSVSHPDIFKKVVREASDSTAS